LLNHTASAQNGTFEKAGQIDFCPCVTGGVIGGISNDQEDENADSQEWGIGDGSRDFSPIGRGLLTYPVYNDATQAQRNAIAYVVTNNSGSDTTTGSSRLFMMSTDVGNLSPGIGTADFINAVPNRVYGFECDRDHLHQQQRRLIDRAHQRDISPFCQLSSLWRRKGTDQSVQ
jgi:hypothetical protein